MTAQFIAKSMSEAIRAIADLRAELDIAYEHLHAAEAELVRLRAENARLHQFRNGHLPDCAGYDLNEMRCGCGYLEGTAYRDLLTSVEKAEAERDAQRELFAAMMIRCSRGTGGCVVIAMEGKG